MPTKLVCPDCGGVIGETGPGESPCTCFATPKSRGSGNSSDTDAIGVPATFEKVCFICGKNVAGHRRIKDSRGYMCYACAKEQRRAEKEGKVECKACRKLIKPAGLVPFEGRMICRKCYSDVQETAKFKKKISTEHFDAHEKRRLIVLGIVFGVLAIIVLYAFLRRKLGG